MGANEITQTLQEALDVAAGATTEDRPFSLKTVRCLGACGLAPVVMTNEDTHGHVTPSSIVDTVGSYRGSVHASH